MKRTSRQVPVRQSAPGIRAVEVAAGSVVDGDGVLAGATVVDVESFETGAVGVPVAAGVGVPSLQPARTINSAAATRPRTVLTPPNRSRQATLRRTGHKRRKHPASSVSFLTGLGADVVCIGDDLRPPSAAAAT